MSREHNDRCEAVDARSLAARALLNDAVTGDACGAYPNTVTVRGAAYRLAQRIVAKRDAVRVLASCHMQAPGMGREAVSLLEEAAHYIARNKV